MQKETYRQRLDRAMDANDEDANDLIKVDFKPSLNVLDTVPGEYAEITAWTKHYVYQYRGSKFGNSRFISIPRNPGA